MRRKRQPDYDFQNLLNSQIGKFKEPGQVESTNEMLYNTLSSLNSYVQDRFDRLTREIRDESAFTKDVPAIRVAVCLEGDVNKQLFMQPVSTEPPICSNCYVTTVFAECDYSTIQKIARQSFNATIWGKTGPVETKVELQYSLKYLQKMGSLYHVFSENELPWQTVNGIYFYKFLDVFCELEKDQGIDSFDIDFGEFEKYLSYDKVLLWNVAPITAAVESCEARPAYDAVQYEHMLKKLQLDDDQYIVCPLGDRFSCFRRGREMFVRTYTKRLAQINLLRIIGGEDAGGSLYLQAKSNKRKTSLIDAYARGRYLPTRGEAERIVNSFYEETELSLQDVKILPSSDETASRQRGVNFNYFIETNSFLPDRKLMLFSFAAGKRDIWTYEKMFYLLSLLQCYFFEYRCIGEVV